MSNNRFLPPPIKLSQSLNSDGDLENGLTRRSFIKRSGGATVSAFALWNATALTARAGVTGTHTSCEIDGTFNQTPQGATVAVTVTDPGGNNLGFLNVYVTSSLSGNNVNGPWKSPKDFTLEAKATFNGKSVVRTYNFTASCNNPKVDVAAGQATVNPTTGSVAIPINNVTYTLTVTATPDSGDNYAKLKDVKATVTRPGAGGSFNTAAITGTQDLQVSKHTP